MKIRYTAIVFVVGLALVLLVQAEKQDLEKKYEEAKERIAEKTEENGSFEIEIWSEKDEEEEKETVFFEHVPELDIDHEQLYWANKDYVGWLDIPGTNISYPVVKGEDNKEYEHMSFEKEYLYEGTLFMDAWEDTDDDNLIIYGHNMKNGEKFGNLKLFLDDEWFENYLYIDFYPLHGKASSYKIFAVRVASSDINSLNYEFRNLDFEEYIENARGEAKKYREPEKLDKIITLSTCYQGNDEVRLLVSGMQINSGL